MNDGRMNFAQFFAHGVDATLVSSSQPSDLWHVQRVVPDVGSYLFWCRPRGVAGGFPPSAECRNPRRFLLAARGLITRKDRTQHLVPRAPRAKDRMVHNCLPGL